VLRTFAAFLCVIGLSGCQARAFNPTPTVPAVPSTTPSAQPTAGMAGVFFDDFDMMDALSGWAWKGISQLYRTDDGGATWHEIHLQGKMQVTGGQFLDSQEAWLPGVPDADLKQAVYRTTDGGKTWTPLGSVAGPNLELHFQNASTGWALNGTGAAGNIFYQAYRTTDGGRTWMHLDVFSRGGLDQGPMAGMIHVMTGDPVSFMAPDTIWIASGYGLSTPYAGLTVSRDGGKTWQDVNPVLPDNFVAGKPPVAVAAPQFVTKQDAYLPVTVGNRLVFFMSDDGGASWALLPPVLPSAQMRSQAQFVNMKDGFTVCSTSLCTTRDGGQTWQQVATPFPFESSGVGAFVSHFDFVDGLNGWAMLRDQQATNAFLNTTDGGRTWIRLMPQLGF